MQAPRYITYVPLADLHPAERNPKLHELERIIASIKEHGFVETPIADERTGRIIAGHGRREALIEMQVRGERTPDGLIVDDDGGWLVPVTRGWSSRDDREAEAVIINLNRLTAAAGWEPRTMEAMLEDLATQAPDLFDSLCISDDEMETLLRQVDPETLPGQIAEDERPPTLHLVDGDGGDGEGVSADDDGRARLIGCPACGHQFTPGR